MANFSVKKPLTVFVVVLAVVVLGVVSYLKMTPDLMPNMDFPYVIIVTADHETGGMTIGFATTAYDTHFNYLENQTISWVQFDDVIAGMRDNGATFEDALAEIETYYGLTTEEGQDLTLTEAEIESLKAAFELSMLPAEERVLGDEEALLYGGYEPLSMAVCHIINNKAGISFTSYSHTGLPVAVLAQGVGADTFNGYYDNTDIYNKLADLLNIA